VKTYIIMTDDIKEIEAGANDMIRSLSSQGNVSCSG
jgi:hypothetical protein